MWEGRCDSGRSEVATVGLKFISNPGLEMTQSQLANQGREQTTLARFRTSGVRINAIRLSTRGSAITCAYAKNDAAVARRRRGQYHRIATLYKRKADKVRPVDSDKSDGSTPGGLPNWKERAWKRVEHLAKKNGDSNSKYNGFVTPRTASFPRGQRLTPERCGDLIVGDDVWPEERKMLEEVLLCREAALAWTFDEMGRVSSEVVPPQQIRTVPHKAWQAKAFPLPKAIRGTIIEMLEERLAAGVYEHCHSPYRNPWFTVKKKNGKYRIVNAAMNINRETIRDATLPPSADEFSELVAGMAVSSLIDWFSGYDQITLDVLSRDITAFQTPLGLLRQTTLPQGATNSVAQFVRISLRILEGVPGNPYLDDITVDGPKDDYDEKEVPELPGVRRYMFEHLLNLDKVLLAVELSGATVAGEKSQWLMPGIKVVGYVCDRDGRHPEAKKIAKVVDWPEPRNVTEVKGFLGLCVYYRIWVENFASIAGPLYRLTKKGVEFNFDEDCRQAMATLQERLTTAPALVTLNHDEEAGKIVLVVDGSPTGWGAILMQEQMHKGKWKRHPARYESGIWSKAESGYDQGKRECRALLKALKKFRQWLYGVHFYVESDANTLCAQLNRSATDLPGALMTQWLAWIRMFDFEIRHIPGDRNQAADALSRKRPTKEDVREREQEEDIEEWVDKQLRSIRLCPIRLQEELEDEVSSDRALLDADEDRILEDEYNEESKAIAVFLQKGMKKREDHLRGQHQAFRKKARNFCVRGKHLFRRESAKYPLPRRVVDCVRKKEELLRAAHDDAGHKGKENTYRRLADRYYWENMWKDVEAYRLSCAECQKRENNRRVEELTPTWTDTQWEKVGLDVVHMPRDKGKSYLVAARSDISGWIEARALASATSEAVATFLWEDVICRHGIFRKLVVDGGPENKGLVTTLAEKYGIRRVVVSAYHPEANGLVERGHTPIVDALSKMGGGLAKWVENLHTVLWADRTTVRRSTGLTPYEVEFANRPILPIEIEVPTWSVMNWDEVRTTGDLVATRARILERREEDMEEVGLHLRRMREQSKEVFDATRNVRTGRLIAGTLVLLHNHKKEVDMSRDQKLSFRWLGPYRVRDVVEDRGTYLLEELDGAQLRGTYAGSRLKPFVQRQREQVQEDGSLDEVVEFGRGEGRALSAQDVGETSPKSSAVSTGTQRVVVNVPNVPAGWESIPRIDRLPPRPRGRPRKVLEAVEHDEDTER